MALTLDNEEEKDHCSFGLRTFTPSFRFAWPSPVEPLVLDKHQQFNYPQITQIVNNLQMFDCP